MSYPRLYEATEATKSNKFETLGLGTLGDTISCIVTEERNGEYELEMEYPVSGKHFDDINVDCLLMCKANESTKEQIFRIYKIEKPMDGIITVYAEHISYLLNKAGVMPFTATSAAEALINLNSNIKWHDDNKNFPTFPFTFSADNNTSGTLNIEEPLTVRSALGGTEGSILDVFGGEYEFDNFEVKLYKNRGTDRHVYLRYGKNITDLTNTDDISEVYTGILPYWKGSITKATKDEDGNDTTESEETMVYLDDFTVWSDNTADFAYPMLNIVDFSSDIETNDDRENNVYTTADDIRKELKTQAEEYVKNNAGWKPSNNLEVSFINLWDTPEYEEFAALQRVYLCDTVHVIYPVLNVDVSMKVITTEYNVLLDRYDKIELGEPKSSFVNSSIKASTDTENKVDEINSTIESEVRKAGDRATEIINGKLNNLTGVSRGYVVFETEDDGSISEILIMDTNNKGTAKNVWRWNSGGLGYSSTGYNGPFNKLALTADGQIVADLITTGTLTATVIKAGILKDLKGNNSWNLDTGEFKLQAVAGSTVGGSEIATSSTVSTAKTEAINSAVSTAKADTTTAINNAMTQSNIFNKLTNNGATQGIYLSNGKIYINGTYIQAGTISADLIKSGVITDAAGNTSWNLTTGAFSSKSFTFMLNKTGTGVGTGNGVYIGSDGIAVGQANASGYTKAPAFAVHLNDDFSNVQSFGYRLFRKDGGTGGYVSARYDGDKGWCWNCYGEFEGDFWVEGECYADKFTTHSDRRLKDNIINLDSDDSYKFIMGLKPVEFTLKQETNGRIHHGFIAQDVQEIQGDWELAHEMIQSRKNEKDNVTYLGIEYTEIIADLVKVVQKQDQQIAELKNMIEYLDGR